jgi:hypothetical protein
MQQSGSILGSGVDFSVLSPRHHGIRRNMTHDVCVMACVCLLESLGM